MAENEEEAGEKRRSTISLWRGPETKLEQASADTSEKELEVFTKLKLKRHGEESELVPATHGTIDFVLDRDNDAPARFVVVSSSAEAQSICKVMTDAWHLTRPSVILSVTGAAASLDLDTQLEAAYVKGLANAAQSTRSWIITGGSDSGVMALTGKVMSSLGTSTPCIGIAPFGAVMYKEKLIKGPESNVNALGAMKGAGLKVKYWKQDKPDNNTAIDANHTHFVLVDNPKKKSFGGEVEMRANIEEYMAREAGGSKGEVPLVCLCVSGGPGTFDTLLEQLKKENMVLLLAESGGAAGAITQFIEAYRLELQHKTPAATDQDLIDLVDKLAADEHHPISEAERKKINTQAKPDATGKKQTVARVLVAAATAQPPRIHFYRQEEGPFDKAILQVIISSYHSMIEREKEAEQKVRGKDKQLGDLLPSIKPHIVARQKHPLYPARADVLDDEHSPVSWEKPWEGYTPTHFEAEVLAKNIRGMATGNGWADPAEIGPELTEVIRTERKTFENGGKIRMEAGKPINPRGRTGMTGRGTLGKWGPNQAADPIVTRWNPEDDYELQVVAIKRTDTGDWALPGGMVDDGEAVSVTVKREFKEEAGNLATAEERAHCSVLIDKLFSHPKVVYKGYVDDPRSTDNAWIETTAYHFHCTPEIAKQLKLGGGDDAAKAMWLRVDPKTEDRYARLWANHRDWVDEVALRMNGSRLKTGLALGNDSNDSAPVAHSASQRAKGMPTHPGAQLRKPHSSALKKPAETKFNPTPYPERLVLETEQISWQTEMADYEPEDFTAPEADPAHEKGGFCRKTADPVQLRKGGGELGGEELGRGSIDEYAAYLGQVGSEGLGSEALNKARKQAGLDPLPPLEKRQTFEGKITFDDLGRPLNPRGRTGLRGRGWLHSWGPNHAVDTIVTRYHPRHDSLQFVAIPRPGSGDWSLPGNVAKAGTVVAPKVEQILKAEEAVVKEGYKDDPPRGAEEAAHLEHLLQELFASTEKKSVYMGYVDDPRNTDNAWLETSAYHFHCSRELGGMLLLDGREDPTGKNGMGAKWVTMDESDPNYELMYANHKQMVEQVREKELTHLRAGLLMTVVKWGKVELFEKVVNDSNFADQRSPALVQQAFQLGLKLAGNTKQFDVKLIELLLKLNAKPEDVFVSDLFRLVGPNNLNGVVDDAFGYLASLKHTTADASKAADESKGKRLAGSGGSPPPSPMRRSSTLTDSGVFHNVRRRMSRGSSAANLLAEKEEDSVTLAAKSAASEAAKGISLDKEKGTTPWRDKHKDIMNKLVPGYADYATGHKHATAFDLVLWATMVGAFELAEVFWKHKSCESPLRAALIGQEMCRRIGVKKKLRVQKLQQYSKQLSDYSLGILEHLHDQEEARQLLVSRDGQIATVGAKGSRVTSLLDLAIDFNNIEFVAHPFSQGILDEMWMGRSPEGHRVRLTKMEGIFKLALQELAMCMGVQFVEVNVNDLYSWPKGVKDKAATSGGTIKVNVWWTLFGFFQIPLVKRTNAMFSSLFFLILQVAVLFRPHCLPTTPMDYVFAFWAVAIVLEEVEQMLSDWHLYKQNWWNIVDVIRAVLGILVIVMRFWLALDLANRDGTLDAVEWWSQETGGWAHQGSWMLFDDSRVSSLGVERVCEWSWELEFLRTFASGLILISTVRMMEVLTFHKETGVLLVCVSKMINDLYNWGRLMLLITSGFGLVMHMLAPEYRLDGSPGAWRPLLGWFNLDLDISSSGPFWMTYWGLLGFFEPGELSAAPGSAFLAPLALWSYLLIALVLFVNLLIAMFSKSYENVMAQADENWKMKRVLQVKSYITAHPFPPPFNLLTLPPTLLYRLLPRCRSQLKKRWVGGKVGDWPSPGGGGGGGSGGGGGGGGGGNPRGSFKKTATSFSAEMEENDKGLFAAWTFTAAKAQAVEERARRAFLDSKERTEEENEKVPRKLEQLEKLVLEVTEATKKLQDKLDRDFEPRPRRSGNALVAAVRSTSPSLRRTPSMAAAARELLPPPLDATLDATLDAKLDAKLEKWSHTQLMQPARTPEMSEFHAKLDRLSQQVEGLAAGAPREEQAPPPMDMKLEAKLDQLSELVKGSSRPGASEAEGVSSFHTNLERISQQVHQVALNQQMVSQQVQQQGQQQVQQQAQAFMNQRYEVGTAHTAGAGQHLAPPNPQHGQASKSKPQPSQASYLQKAASKRANWTPSGSIQPLTPLAGGVILTGGDDAQPQYRSAPDLPAGPPVPTPPVVPAPGAPSPVKRGVSFAS